MKVGDTHQVVAEWSPSPAQEDFPSATDFHTLLLPLCISSTGRMRRKTKTQRETERLFKPDRMVSVFYGSMWTDTKSLKTSSLS